MRTRLTKAVYGAGAAALLGLCIVANPAMAQDKTIRIGVTLRMLVESGLIYGAITRTNSKR
jgi:hypothetical protein